MDLSLFGFIIAYGVFCFFAGIAVWRNRNTKEGTPSASHNKPRNAISKGTCITCAHCPTDENYLLFCGVDGVCFEGELWKPLETASIG
ncbi:MAG: hypothetical protein KC517_09330 [Bacteroidetes bacterium]|nr:hypothetical protein [Bacteroidota bacterium]